MVSVKSGPVFVAGMSTGKSRALVEGYWTLEGAQPHGHTKPSLVASLCFDSRETAHVSASGEAACEVQDQADFDGRWPSWHRGKDIAEAATPPCLGELVGLAAQQNARLELWSRSASPAVPEPLSFVQYPWMESSPSSCSSCGSYDSSLSDRLSDLSHTSVAAGTHCVAGDNWPGGASLVSMSQPPWHISGFGSSPASYITNSQSDRLSDHSHTPVAAGTHCTAVDSRYDAASLVSASQLPWEPPGMCSSPGWYVSSQSDRSSSFAPWTSMTADTHGTAGDIPLSVSCVASCMDGRFEHGTSVEPTTQRAAEKTSHRYRKIANVFSSAGSVVLRFSHVPPSFAP
jgi:hypothetical protein